MATKDRDSAFKPPPQKHALIYYDRELFGQMSLDLEVPILEVAVDNNIVTEGDENDITLPKNMKKSRAYNVLEQHSRSDASRDARCQSKPADNVKGKFPKSVQTKDNCIFIIDKQLLNLNYIFYFFQILTIVWTASIDGVTLIIINII